MKSLLKYILILSTILFSVSCNNDDEDSKKPDLGLPIRFSVGSLSRATQEGTFEDGDAIGIFAYSPKTESVYAVNKKYVFDGKNFLAATEDDEIWVTASADVDFYAYYPYLPGQTDINSIVYSIKDQSTREGWLESDFLTAAYTQIVEDYTIQLDFYHRFSTIKVNISDNNKNRVVMNNVKTTANFNLLSGTYTVSDTKADIAMYQTVQGNGEFLVTLPAQEISPENKVVISDGSGQEVELSTNETITTEEGKIHNYVIENQKQIIINNYENGGVTSGDGAYFLGSSCTISAQPKDGYEFEGWYENGVKISSESELTFEVLKDRTFDVKYISYGDWEISLSADPAEISARGGTSQITSTATANVYINDEPQAEKKTDNPVVSIKEPVPGFSYDDEKKTLTAGLNQTEAPRSVTLVAEIGGVTKELVITQNGEKFEYSPWIIVINASPNPIKADGTQTSTLTASAVRDVLLEGEIIQKNVEDDNLQLSGKADGFTFDPSSKIVTATNNTTTSSRSIKITATPSIDADNILETSTTSVVVTQEAGVQSEYVWSEWVTESITVTANPKDIPYDGGTSQLTVEAHQKREADVIWNGIKVGVKEQKQTIDVTTSSSTQYSNTGTNGFTHNKNVVEAGSNVGGNDRSITVNVTYDGMKGSVTVTQSGGVVTYDPWEITLSANPTTIAAKGGSSTITATAKRNKYVNGKPVEPDTEVPSLSGSATGFTLSDNVVTADENMNASTRTITITATVGTGNEQKTKNITITQSAAVIKTTYDISISASPTTIAAKGGSSTITASCIETTTINGGHETNRPVTPTLSHSGQLSWSASTKTLSAGNNTSINKKSSTITASYPGATSKSITVTQSAGEKTYGNWSSWATISLNATASPSTIDYKGGSSTVSVTAYQERERDILWNGITTDTDKDEQTINVTSSATYSGSASGFTRSGNIVSASNNTGGSDRSITVTASYGGKSDNVTITQSGASVTYGDWVVSISANPTTIAAKGGSSTITAKATRTKYINGESAGTETATPTLSGGTGNGFSRSGNTVTASNNTSTSSRSTTVTASYGGKSDNVTITQSGASVTYGDWVVSISANPTTIAAKGGSSTITAKATRTKYINGESAGTETATPTLSGGTGNGFSRSGNTVTASNNTSTSSRSTTVTASYGGKSDNVTITQSAGSKTETYTNTTYENFSISCNTSTMSYSGGSRSASATVTKVDHYDVIWNGIKTTTTTKSSSISVTSSASWSGTNCSVSNGNISVGANPSTSSRTITVKATYQGLSDQVSFTQEGKPSVTEYKNYVFTVTPSSLSFDVDGGTKNFSVTSTRDVYVDGVKVRTENVGYSASASGTGLSCSKSSATFTANSSTSRRTGTITLTQDTSGKKAYVECDQDRWYNVGGN